jgi:hypothetical protein
MSCAICVENFNKSTRKKVKCKSCEHVCCLTCTKTYLLQCHQPHCMSCRSAWDMEWMNHVLPKSFVKNDYRTMRETVLFEEEKTYLPASQPEASRRTKIEKIEALIDVALKKKRENYINEDQLVRDQRIKDRELDGEIKILEQQRIELSKRRASERREFIMACPLEDCRGFLNNHYKCGMCDKQICKDCHHIKLEEHTCDPNEVATVTELRQNTKPCPKCNAPIFKVDGCDQMYCIRESCHTAFSWRTGQIETGVIHNPEYLRLVREGLVLDRRDRQDHGGCGPIPNYATVYRTMRLYAATIPSQERTILHSTIEMFYQQCTHHRQITHNRLAERPDRSVDRIDYLMGKLDETKFKQRLFVSHQKELRFAEERQVIDVFVTTGEELFRSMTATNVPEIIAQFKTLYRLTYDAVSIMDKKYQHKGLLQTQLFV